MNKAQFLALALSNAHERIRAQVLGTNRTLENVRFAVLVQPSLIDHYRGREGRHALRPDSKFLLKLGRELRKRDLGLMTMPVGGGIAYFTILVYELERKVGDDAGDPIYAPFATAEWKVRDLEGDHGPVTGPLIREVLDLLNRFRDLRKKPKQRKALIDSLDVAVR